MRKTGYDKKIFTWFSILLLLPVVSFGQILNGSFKKDGQLSVHLKLKTVLL
jgi:hypothetical protein